MSIDSSWLSRSQLSLTGGSAVERIGLSNGIGLVIVPNPVADVVAARCFFRGGSSVERGDRAGVAALMAAVLTKGTHQRSSRDIANEVESLGAGLGAESTPDYFEMSFKCVADDFPRMLALVAEILRQPTFPEREVERERKVAQQALQARRERPFTLAYERVRRELYGPYHPYARSTIGTLQSLADIDRGDLVEYHHTFLQPDRLTIAIAGKIEPDNALRLTDEYFGDWSTTATPAISAPIILPQRDRAILYETPQETQQAIVMLGFRGAPALSPDYVSLKVLGTYLGNGSSSRLFVELRDKLGLAYEVTSLYATRCDEAPFLAYLGTTPDNTSVALAKLRHELELLSQAPLQAADVDSAQRKMLGQYALGKQTNDQLAQTLGWYESLGLGVEFDAVFPEAIASVTPERLQAVAQTYLRYPVISVAGPQTVLDSLKVPH